MKPRRAKPPILGESEPRLEPPASAGQTLLHLFIMAMKVSTYRGAIANNRQHSYRSSRFPFPKPPRLPHGDPSSTFPCLPSVHENTSHHAFSDGH